MNYDHVLVCLNKVGSLLLIGICHLQNKMVVGGWMTVRLQVAAASRTRVAPLSTSTAVVGNPVGGCAQSMANAHAALLPCAATCLRCWEDGGQFLEALKSLPLAHGSSS